MKKKQVFVAGAVGFFVVPGRKSQKFAVAVPKKMLKLATQRNRLTRLISSEIRENFDFQKSVGGQFFHFFVFFPEKSHRVWQKIFESESKKDISEEVRQEFGQSFSRFVRWLERNPSGRK